MTEPPAKHSLLIVDDSPVIVTRILEAVSVLLGEEGVAVASSMSEALEYLKTHHPDIVILDCNIAGESGFRVLNAIRSSGQGTYVIAWSTDLNPITMRKYIEAGADSVLDKTHEFEELLPHLRQSLTTRKVLKRSRSSRQQSIRR